MKIAMLTDFRHRFDSLTHVYNNTESVLNEKFEIIRLPADYDEASEARKLRINAEIMDACDVVVARADLRFLEAREGLRKHMPYALFMFGGAPRGMPHLRRAWRYLRTSDVLLGNCAGDLSITKAFFPNSQTTLIPFPVDETTFFRMSAADRRKARAGLGFSDADKVLLYSGQITLEKNIHTLIVLFSALQALDPHIHLVLAGSVIDFDFEDFGVVVSGTRKWLKQLAGNLSVDRKRLRFIGHKTPAQLRVLYNVADVVVNMTLHHDENFGLPQVEAMACGTPVVGTNWGGLQETILHTVTGLKVSTIVTDAGVKSNWLEAADNILGVLRRSQANRKMSHDCRDHAVERYSMAKYGQVLEEVLASAAKSTRPGDRLTLSAFGRELWSVCARERPGKAPYRRGRRSFVLYQRLIRPYAGGSTREIGRGDIDRRRDFVYLPWPVTLEGNVVEIHDPMFPMKISIPRKYRRILPDLAQTIDGRAISSVENLARHYVRDYTAAQVKAALEWMLRSGILLTSRNNKVRAAFGGFGDKRCFSFEAIER